MFAVFSHDAGGAEILSSLIARKKLPCLFTLQGPAIKIFVEKLGSIDNNPLRDNINKADVVLCSTSWESDLEFNAIKYAKSICKPTVGVIDHWINYNERFVRNGETILPDEIWVCDKNAEAIALEKFPKQKIKLIDNYYFRDIRDQLKIISTNRDRRYKNNVASVLYVCEPIRKHALEQFGDENYLRYTEEKALTYFLSNTHVINERIESIKIRPHPSEAIDKYNWVQDKFDLPIAICGSNTLIQEILESDVVVGCESMAMVVGIIAKKEVISCIPPDGKACALPHAEIQHLQRLLLHCSIAKSR